MMGEENSSREFHQTRTVLGDVTNRVRKRDFPFISACSDLKSGAESSGNVENKGGGSQFAKSVCSGGEILKNEKCTVKRCANEKEKGKRVCVSPLPCGEINLQKGNIIAGILERISESKLQNVSEGRCERARSIAAIADVGHASISMPMSAAVKDSLEVGENCDDDEERVCSEATEGDPIHEQEATYANKDDDNDLEADNSTELDCSKLPESQESRSSESEKCAAFFKTDCCSNSCEGSDLIKACSGSFCTKAAYIWSDLHYQDIKGRLAALKKIQKDASNIIKKKYKNLEIDKNSQRNNRSSKIESELMGQWRSLFLHMEDIYDQENSQLEAHLLALQGLRESCKTKLELINGMASGKK